MLVPRAPLFAVAALLATLVVQSAGAVVKGDERVLVVLAGGLLGLVVERFLVRPVLPAIVRTPKSSNQRAPRGEGESKRNRGSAQRLRTVLSWEPEVV